MTELKQFPQRAADPAGDAVAAIAEIFGSRTLYWNNPICRLQTDRRRSFADNTLNGEDEEVEDDDTRISRCSLCFGNIHTLDD